MPPEETVSKSPLDKPLCQLTEDDISQLTREDCRRYLKQKGMRKPSWNKSQAIQQVISLKALLETTPVTDAGTRKKLHIPRAHTHVQRGKNTDGEPSEPVPDGRNQQDKTDLSGHIIGLPATAVDNSAPSRTIGSADTPVGQMTISYCGKVNVYDDVPADKAQTIMCLASSPLSVPSETPLKAVAARHSACFLQTANTKIRPDTDMKQWRAPQAGKHHYKDIVRSEKTGITITELFGAKKMKKYKISGLLFCLFLSLTYLLGEGSSARERYK